ncbi:hypothetical protein E4U43_000661 [Claviceps pusilla]|uniref:Aminoglycoside phosphotransferase domain-containing protein n=1 Tax=Claviceps pusilla TaxID=123648 RepID=A0A9P7N9F3_9HYPO|nr:hypothetical protein E4U43_000661 [Claviceps pusilla]
MTTRDLLTGPITLSAALEKDDNVLHALTYPEEKKAFYVRLYRQRHLLSGVIAHHLGTKSTDIRIPWVEHWRHGSFNLCIPVVVKTDPSVRPRVPEFVTIRFPLPYRVGEATNPGNSDEKVNCEAATYAWLQENCPTVPIPKLYGFGLSTNQRFTHLDLLPWWTRWFRRIRNYFLAAFGFPQPTPYVPHCSSDFVDLDVGYLLIETIVSGRMLSETWDEKYKDVRLQENVQRSLARIMLSLASVSLPRIGSFRLDNKGYLHLDHRPLAVQFTMHENEGIPLDISRKTTFSRVDDFVQSHLAAFDNRLLHQPNGIRSYDDACYQMTALAVARTVLPQAFRRDLNTGPFVYGLTDTHRSNIFVDEDWNITCMIDLEYACSLPIEFIQPPYWLDGGLIDQIDSVGYAPKHDEFLKHVRHEEQLQNSQRRGEQLSSIMEQSWNNGTFWATLALSHAIAFEGILLDQLLVHYFSFTMNELPELNHTLLARLWRRNISSIIDRKLQDTEKYREKLKEAFTDAASPAI